MKGAVLVPLDGSQVAEAALPFAGWIATATGGGLTLATVAPDEAPALKALQAVAAATTGDGAGTPAMEVLQGEAAEAIAARAATGDIGLVVLTTFACADRGHHLGAVADRLSRTLTKPALFVSPASDARAPITGPVLVALDGSPTAEEVIEPSVELATQLGRPLVLVRVAPWANELFAAATYPYPPDADEEMELGSNTYLAALVERLPASLDANYQTLRGRAAEMLVEYAQNQAGLLVLCSHGQSASHLWHLGSTTDKVLRISSQPVLIVPALHRGGPPA